MYLYFDYKGTLLETVNDQALRQYNKGVNTVNIYIESEPDSATGIVPDDGKIPSYIKGIQYWFQLANGDKLQSETYAVETKVRKTIPFDRKRDLRHFKYGKQYEFFSFSIPSGLYERSEVNANTVNFVSEGDVFKSSGLALMTVQALTERINDDDTVSKGAISLERVAFTVEDAVVLPEDIVSTSEFNWLLQEYVFGDYLRAQLVYTKVDVINSDPAFTKEKKKYSIDLEFGLFNRDPKADDVFLYVYTNASSTNIALATVDEVRGQVVSCSFLRSNSVSIKGEKGDKGDKGETGKTPSIKVSATVNNTVGVPAVSVTNWGTAENPDFRFAFKYLKGDTGVTPNISVSADVDANVGKPSVSVSKSGTPENPNFAFTFKNMKGTKGDTGATPNIKATASVGTSMGTPIVSVTKSGTAENPRFSFDFDNLRGRDGMTPNITASADVDTGMGTPSVSVSKSGTTENPNFAFAFKNLKGESALVYQGLYDSEFIIYPPESYTHYMRLPLEKFNRTPVKGEEFVLFSNASSYANCFVYGFTTTGGEALCFARNVINIQGASGPMGPTGNAGKDALMFYDVLDLKYPAEYYVNNNIALAWTKDIEKSFNRKPEKSDAFIAIARGVANEYIVLASIDTSQEPDLIYISQYTSIRGDRGLTGATGADGVGISSASVKSVEETEEYTSTTVSFTKTDSTTSDVVIKAKNALNPNTVSFIGTVTVDMWQDSTTYSTYGYKYSALMPFTGGAYATDTYVPDIVPSVVSDIASGNFAPFANSLSTGVQVYAKAKPTATTNFNVSLSHVQ